MKRLVLIIAIVVPFMLNGQQNFPTGIKVNDKASISSNGNINTVGTIRQGSLTDPDSIVVTRGQLKTNLATKQDTGRWKYVKMDTTISTPNTSKSGQISWNGTANTLDVTLKNGVVMQMGQEMPIYVQNNSGTFIPNGKAVYIYDAGGEIERIRLADNRYIGTSYKYIGLTTCDIPHGGSGYVCISGKVHELNTSGMIEGNVVYLTTSGNWSQTKPINAHIISLGYITYAHPNHGIITVAKNQYSSTYFNVLNNLANHGVYIDSSKISISPAIDTDTTFRVLNTTGSTVVSFLGNGKFNSKTGQFGGKVNYINFDSISAILLNGNTTTFEDLQFPFTTGTSGGNPYPTFDTDSLYWNFVIDTTGVTKCIQYFLIQMPHSWKEGSIIYPHVHYKYETAVGTPTFKLKYKWYPTTGSTQIGWKWLTLSTTTGTTDKTIEMITNTSGISGVGKTISSIIIAQVYLVSQTGTGNVHAYQMDIHYEKDGFGSNTLSDK